MVKPDASGDGGRPRRAHAQPAIEASKRIEHLCMRFEEALPLMRERGDRIELLVCDINAPPSQVVSMVMQALPVLADGCPLVLTFKQTLPSKGAWAAAVDAALRDLGSIAERVEVLHLLANTSKETTVVGRLQAGASSG